MVVLLWMVECAQDKCVHIDCLAQYCGNSSALAMQLLQSCIGPSRCGCINAYIHVYTYMYVYAYLHTYVCAKIYEGFMYIIVGRVVHRFLYMRSILFIVSIPYFD